MGTIALWQLRYRKLEFQDPLSFNLIEQLLVESLQGKYGYNLASITSSVSHLTCCFYPTTCFCGPVLFAKVLGPCQTLCTPGKLLKSLSAAADLSSGLQLKAQVLRYFIAAAAELQTAGRSQDWAGNFMEICWLVQSDPRGSLSQQELFMC